AMTSNTPHLVLLRCAQIRHAKRLAWIDRAAQPPALGWSEGHFQQILEDRQTTGVVATLEGRIVGYMLLTHNKRGTIHIIRMAVLPWYQRQGIGRRFLERLFQSQGDRNIFTMVRDSRLVAHLFLKALGFRRRKKGHSSFRDSISDACPFFFSEEFIPLLTT